MKTSPDVMDILLDITSILETLVGTIVQYPTSRGIDTRYMVRDVHYSIFVISNGNLLALI